MANGATPLGYGAAVLPQSTFDPLAAGRFVTGLAQKQAEETKKEADQQLKDSLEAINPNLGKLNWSAAFMGEYKDKLDKWRKQNVQWYRNQNGRLSVDQLTENKRFREETKAEFDIINTEYDKFLKLKQKVLTSPKFNTAANREAIKKFENPQQFDKENFKKAGGFLQYIQQNPLNITPKVDAPDLLARAKKYMENAGIDKKIGQITSRPDLGVNMIEKISSVDIEAAKLAAGIDWDSDPVLQAFQPDKQKFIENMTPLISQVTNDFELRKQPTDATGRTSSNGVSHDNRFNVAVTSGEIVRDPQRVEHYPLVLREYMKNDRNVPVAMIDIFGKKASDLEMNSNITGGQILIDGKWQDLADGNYDFNGGKIIISNTTTQNIRIPPRVYGLVSEELRNIAPDGVIPSGTEISPAQAEILKGINYGNQLAYTPYVLSEVETLLKKPKPLGKKVEGERFQKESVKGLAKIPFNQVRGQYIARSIDFDAADVVNQLQGTQQPQGQADSQATIETANQVASSGTTPVNQQQPVGQEETTQTQAPAPPKSTNKDLLPPTKSNVQQQQTEVSAKEFINRPTVVLVQRGNTIYAVDTETQETRKIKSNAKTR